MLSGPVSGLKSILQHGRRVWNNDDEHGTHRLEDPRAPHRPPRNVSPSSCNGILRRQRTPAATQLQLGPGRSREPEGSPLDGRHVHPGHPRGQNSRLGHAAQGLCDRATGRQRAGRHHNDAPFVLPQRLRFRQLHLHSARPVPRPHRG